MISPPRLVPPIANPPEPGRWTYDDWARLPDDGYRYEVIDGVLHMAPPPGIAHQYSSIRLATLMVNYVSAHNLGEVFDAPIGVQIPGQAVPLQPDIVFVSAARSSIIGRQHIEGAPDLIVEILSPGNWPYDRQEKFRVYEMAGVPEYWIVDYRAKTIEVFVLEEGEYTLIGRFGAEAKATSRIIGGFEVAVADIFQK